MDDSAYAKLMVAMVACAKEHPKVGDAMNASIHYGQDEEQKARILESHLLAFVAGMTAAVTGKAGGIDLEITGYTNGE